MFKLLVIAVIFAVPTFSRWDNGIHKRTKKSIIEGVYLRYGRSFSEKCTSVSSAVGVDVDFEKHETIYDAYNDCATEVGDYEQFFHEAQELLTNVWMVRRGSVRYLSDNHRAGMVAFLQTYCPKVINYIKCDDVVSPIYEQCYTNSERNETAVGKDSWLRMLENFCENNVEHLVDTINTKGLECGICRGFSCFRNHGISSDPFSNPSLRSFCHFHNMIINCMGPVFQECELSQTPDTLMKSFFANIETEKLCEHFPKLERQQTQSVAQSCIL